MENGRRDIATNGNMDAGGTPNAHRHRPNDSSATHILCPFICFNYKLNMSQIFTTLIMDLLHSVLNV